MNKEEFGALSYEEKIVALIEHPEEVGMPFCACILAQLLADYRPVLPPTAHIDNMSSSEIEECLRSTTEVSIKNIGKVMMALGYRLHIEGDYVQGWAMKHVDSI